MSIHCDDDTVDEGVCYLCGYENPIINDNLGHLVDMKVPRPVSQSAMYAKAIDITGLSPEEIEQSKRRLIRGRDIKLAELQQSGNVLSYSSDFSIEGDLLIGRLYVNEHSASGKPQ